MKKLILLTLFLLALVAPVFAAVNIAVETSNVTTAFNRLQVLGLDVRDAIDGDRNHVKIEDRLGICNTPILEGLNGKYYFTFRVEDDFSSHIPNQDTPNFAVLWRSDEVCGTEEEPEVCPWPMVEVQSYDKDGLPDGTHMQGIGTIL
jgi:hypothetical protein